MMANTRAKCLSPFRLPAMFREAVGKVFFRYGEFCVKYPCAPITFSIILVLVCGVGVLFLETEADSYNLYYPTDMVAYKNYKFIEDTFDSTIRYTEVYFVVRENEQSVSLPRMREAFRLHKKIIGDTIEFEKWCVRTNTTVPCVWIDIFSRLSINKEAEVEKHVNDGTLENAMVQTKAEGQNGNQKCLRLNYQYESKGDLDAFHEWREKWEEDAVDVVLAAEPTEFESYAVMNEEHIMIETEKLTSAEIPLFGVASLLIVIVVTFMISGKPCLRSRIALGGCTMLSVILSFVCACGLSGYCGFKWSAASILLFWILLGIGVDDIIVIIRHCDMERGPYAERIPKGLQKSGLAITLTNLTSVCAFASAMQVPMPVIAEFCSVGAFGILMDFVMQITFFVGVFVYDERRRDAGRLDCCCCVKKAEEAAGQAALSVQDLPGLAERAFKHYGKVLTRPVSIFAASILLILAVILPATQLPQVTTDFDFKTVYPTESALVHALTIRETYFAAWPSQLYIYIDHSSIGNRFLNPQEIEALDRTYTSLTAMNWASPPKIGRDRDDWTYAFRRWSNDDYWSGGVAPQRIQDATLRESPFKMQLPAFLSAHRFPLSTNLPCPSFCVEPWVFRTDLVLDNGVPTWSRVYMQAEYSKSSNERYRQMNDALRIGDENLGPINGFLFDRMFISAERDDRMLGDLISSLSITTVVVAGVVMLLLDPIVGIFVGVCIALVDMAAMGVLIGLGNPLSTLAYLNLSMVIGMCVDYIVHVAHEMLHEFKAGKAPAAVVEHSLAKVGRCIWEGAFSTLLGLVLPAIFAKSQAARNFGQTMSIAIIFGATYGLVFAPTAMYLAMCIIQRCTVAGTQAVPAEKTYIATALAKEQSAASDHCGQSAATEKAQTEKGNVASSHDVQSDPGKKLRNAADSSAGPEDAPREDISDERKPLASVVGRSDLQEDELVSKAPKATPASATYQSL